MLTALALSLRSPARPPPTQCFDGEAYLARVSRPGGRVGGGGRVGFTSDVELRRRLDEHDQLYQSLGGDINGLVATGSPDPATNGQILGLQVDYLGFYARWQGWYQEQTQQSSILIQGDDLSSADVKAGLNDFDHNYDELRQELIALGGRPSKDPPKPPPTPEDTLLGLSRNVAIAVVAGTVAVIAIIVKTSLPSRR